MTGERDNVAGGERRWYVHFPSCQPNTPASHQINVLRHAPTRSKPTMNKTSHTAHHTSNNTHTLPNISLVTQPAAAISTTLPVLPQQLLTDAAECVGRQGHHVPVDHQPAGHPAHRGDAEHEERRCGQRPDVTRRARVSGGRAQGREDVLSSAPEMNRVIEGTGKGQHRWRCGSRA